MNPQDSYLKLTREPIFLIFEVEIKSGLKSDHKSVPVSSWFKRIFRTIRHFFY